MKKLHVLLMTIFLVGCNHNLTSSSSEVNSGNYTCKKNASKEYQLCVRKLDPGALHITPIEYYVADTEGHKIKSGVIRSGHVLWLDDYAVEIFETPGNISTELSKDDITKVFLIRSGETVTKTNYLNRQ